MTDIPGETVVTADIPAQTVPIRPSTGNVQSQSGDPSIPARTTFQQDLTTAGQRKVNLIWEYTQAVIALMVVFMTMVCGAVGMFKDLQIPTIISVAFGMITGFYFSRTNHAAIGGVGPKPYGSYEGR